MSELHIKFGSLLQDERKRRNLDLASIAVELKIPETTLQAIEVGDTEVVPEELYFNLFAKSYAEHLGIDYSRTIEAIREEFGESLDSSINNNQGPKIESGDSGAPEIDGQAEPTSSNGIVRKASIIGGAVAVGFIGILVAFWFFGSDSETNTSSQGEAQTNYGEPMLEDEAGKGGISYDWDVPQYQAPDSIRLELVANDTCWATIFADGDTVHYKNLYPGRTYRLSALHRLRVSVGVPRVVEVRIDGREAYLADAESGRISRVEIDQTNRDQFFQRPVARSVQAEPAIETTDQVVEATTEPR